MQSKKKCLSFPKPKYLIPHEQSAAYRLRAVRGFIYFPMSSPQPTSCYYVRRSFPMTARKASNVVAMPDAATKPAESKLTYNFRTSEESITIRSDSLEELLQLRDEFRTLLLGPDTTVFHEGSPCPKECGGQLRLRNGSKGAFYGCSGYPRCNFTARA